MILSGLATATTANVLSGSIFEFVKRPSRISVGLFVEIGAARTLSNVGNLFSFQIGDTLIAQSAQVFNQTMVTSGVADTVRYPDDFFIQNEPALAGDRLILQITRAADSVAWVVIMTEVG